MVSSITPPPRQGGSSSNKLVMTGKRAETRGLGISCYERGSIRRIQQMVYKRRLVHLHSFSVETVGKLCREKIEGWSEVVPFTSDNGKLTSKLHVLATFKTSFSKFPLMYTNAINLKHSKLYFLFLPRSSKRSFCALLSLLWQFVNAKKNRKR